MLFRLLKRLTSRAQLTRRSKERYWFRPSLEAMEGRCVPAAYTVTNTNDVGAGSLRAAIEAGNNAEGPHTIQFAAGVQGTITLQSGLPEFEQSFTITGPGAETLAITADPGMLVGFRIFDTGVTTTDSISGLTI